MKRRDFLQGLTALPAAAWFTGGMMPAIGAENQGVESMGQVHTVTGTIAAERLGVTLPHEHLLVDFIGAAESSPDRYDPEEVVATVLPHVRAAQALGVATLVECTPAYLARDPEVMARISAETGLNIITNTGYYGAAQDKFLPPHAFTESADELAARWIREAREGIEDTGILPGFIKTAVDPGPLSEVDRKLLQAAARAHHETGLVIASHTTDAASILETLEVLAEEDLPGDAFIWVHAHTVNDTEVQDRAADAGIWIELDGLSPDSLALHQELLLYHHEQGRLDQVMVSHDAGWYSVGEPGGGDFRRFDTLFTDLRSGLYESGFSDAEWRQLVRVNPARAFRIR